MPSGPSAVHYNPAALPFGSGLAVEAGVFVEHERSSTTTDGGVTARSDSTSASAALFVSQRLGNHFAMGIGVYRAPMQRLDYPDGYSDRFQVQRASFGGTVLTPTVAGRPFSFLSIGFGLSVAFGQLSLSQAAMAASGEARTDVQSKAAGIGGTIGLWARLYRQYLSLGVAYRSAIDMDHSGQATTRVGGAVASVQDAILSMRIPHMITVGFGSRPRPGLSLQLEARVQLLRDMGGFYATTTAESATPIVTMPLTLKEAWQVRFGMEQLLLSNRLAIRAGVGYDFGAGRRDVDAAFPDGDRVVLCAGLGWAQNNLSVDVGYMASFSPSNAGSRGVTYAADYSTVRHLIGLTMAFRAPNVGTAPTWRE